MSSAAAGGGEEAGGCDHCGAEGEMKICSKCHTAKYCGAACQKEHWPEHKKACKQLAQKYSEAMSHSADMRYDAGDYKGALRHAQKAVGVQRQHQDSRDRAAELADSLCTLGSALSEQCRYDEALEKFGEAVAICRTLDGDQNSINLASTLSNMGYVYSKQDKYDLALRHLQEALEILQAIEIQRQVPLAPPVAMPASIGDAEREAMSQSAGLREAFLRSLGLIGRADVRKDLALTIDSIAHVHEEQGMFSKALKSHKEALRIKREMLGDDDVSVGHSIMHIALVHQEQGKYAKALKGYTEVLRINKKCLGHEHPEVASALHTIAVLFNEMGEYSQAHETFKESLRIGAKVLGEMHPQVGKTYYFAGINLLLDEGKIDEGLGHLDKALKIQCEAHGEESLEVADTKLSIARVYAKQGSAPGLNRRQRTELLAKAKGLLTAYADVYAADERFGPEHEKTRMAIEAARCLG